MDTAKPSYINAHAACALLGISRHTLRAWSKQGRIEVDRSNPKLHLYSVGSIEALTGADYSALQLSVALAKRRERDTRRRQRFDFARVKEMIADAVAAYDKRIQSQLTEKSKVGPEEFARIFCEQLGRTQLHIATRTHQDYLDEQLEIKRVIAGARPRKGKRR